MPAPEQQWPPPIPVPADVQAQPARPRQYGFALGLLANAIVVTWILPDASDYFHGPLKQYSDGTGKVLLVALLLLTGFSIVSVVSDIRWCLRAGDRAGVKLALLGVGANVAAAVGLIILGISWTDGDCACGPA